MVNLENPNLSEINQMSEINHSHEVPGIVKFIDIERRMMGHQGGSVG